MEFEKIQKGMNFEKTDVWDKNDVIIIISWTAIVFHDLSWVLMAASQQYEVDNQPSATLPF